MTPADRLPHPPALIPGWLPEILFLTFTTGAGLWAAGRWVEPLGDPGFAWSLAYRLGQGEVLYRDLYLAYAPLTPYLLAGLARVFGSSALSFLLWNWVAAMVAGLLLLRLSRPFLSLFERVGLAGLIIGFSLLVPGPGRLVFPYYPGVVHALSFSLGALLLAGGSAGRLSESARSWLAGLCGGLAFCCKQEIGLVVLAALGASLVLRRKGAVFRAVRIVAGFAAPVALALSVALWSAPLESLRARNHLWPLDWGSLGDLRHLLRVAAGMAEENWLFGVSQTAWQFLAQLLLLAVAALLAARERKSATWLPALLLGAVLVAAWLAQGFRYAPHAPVSLSALASFLLALLVVVRAPGERPDHLVAVSMFAGLVGLRTAFSRTVSAPFDGPAHFAATLTWMVLLCAMIPSLLAPAPKAAAHLRRFLSVLICLVGWSAAVAGAQSLRSPMKRAVATRQGAIYLSEPHAAFFDRLSREIRPGERALVIPEINGIDVIFGARSVSPLLDILPGWLDPATEKILVRRFHDEPPDVVVLFDRPLEEFGVAPFGTGYGRLLGAWISDHYLPAFSAPAGLVLRRSPDAVQRSAGADRVLP